MSACKSKCASEGRVREENERVSERRRLKGVCVCVVERVHIARWYLLGYPHFLKLD